MRPPAPAGQLEPRLELRRSRLLDAAQRLFAERGFHSTSVDDLVAEARMSKSGFYEFFRSKEECFCQLLEQEAGALMAEVVRAAAGGAGRRQRMRLGITAFVSACFRERQVARLFLVEAIGLTPEVEAVHRRILGSFAETVAAEVRRAQSQGAEFAQTDAEVFGRAVAGAVSEVTGHFLDAAPAQPDRLASELCRIFAP